MTRPVAPDDEMKDPDAWAMPAIGAAGGFVGAMLGGGTGTVTVPALDKLTDLRRAVIHGTVALPNLAVAIVGSTVYEIHGGALSLRVGIPMMIGGVLGVQLGARFVARASERTLRAVFIAVLVVAGVKLLLDALGLDPIGTGAVLSKAIGGDMFVVVALGLVLGVVVGAWSAAMGLGGGLLTVPALTLLFGVNLHTAVGTSLLIMLPNSAVGAYTHIRQGTACVSVGRRLAIGAAPGAVIGAIAALALPATALGIIFGGFVLVMAARELRRIRQT